MKERWIVENSVCVHIPATIGKVLASFFSMTLVATILTSSLVSSLVSTIVTNCWTTSKERKQFFRTKLEELFTAYRGYSRLLATAYWYPWMLVMRKTMTYEQADAFKKEALNDTPNYAENCEAIIRLHFDEFLPAWEALWKQYDNFDF